MPTVDSQNTLTADGTEQNIADLTGNQYYWVRISLGNMQSGDTTVIKTYFKTRSTSSLEQDWQETFTDVQTTKKVLNIPWQPSDTEYKITLTQSAGTNRDYDWIIYKA